MVKAASSSMNESTSRSPSDQRPASARLQIDLADFLPGRKSLLNPPGCGYDESPGFVLLKVSSRIAKARQIDRARIIPSDPRRIAIVLKQLLNLFDQILTRSDFPHFQQSLASSRRDFGDVLDPAEKIQPVAIDFGDHGAGCEGPFLLCLSGLWSLRRLGRDRQGEKDGSQQCPDSHGGSRLRQAKAAERVDQREVRSDFADLFAALFDVGFFDVAQITV